MNEMFDYRWHVYEFGYEVTWLKIDRSETFKEFKELNIEGYMSVPHITPIHVNSPKRSYNLLDYPGLFQEFGNIDSLPSIIKFANKYGLLQKPFSKPDNLITLWSKQITVMNFLITTYDLIKNNKYKILESQTMIDKYSNDFIWPTEKILKHITFDYKTSFDFKQHELKLNIVKDGDDFAIEYPYFNKEKKKIDIGLNKIPQMGKIPPQNYSEAVYHYVCAKVNEQLKESLSFQAIVNPRNTGVELIMHPKDLLSTLWLQFAYYISRNLEFKQCADCSNFFEVKSKKRRFAKIYCSDRCRTRVAARNRRNKK